MEGMDLPPPVRSMIGGQKIVTQRGSLKILGALSSLLDLTCAYIISLERNQQTIWPELWNQENQS